MHIWTTPGQHTFVKDHHQVEFWADEQSTNKDAGAGYLRFQDGPISEQGLNGITNEEVLEALIERLQALNKPPFGCRENSVALTHLETGLLWLRYRTQNRKVRGVEGTSTP